MRAFALVAPGNFGWADIPDEPPPGPGQAAVKPLACGVCASDVHYWLHGRIGDQIITSYPYAVGHECAGLVLAVGPDVTGLVPGQRVAVDPARPCGQCRPCRDGRENLCDTPLFTGYTRDGGFATHAIADARMAAPKPAALSFE
jgi:propanol-preferring alcohol dehydrogenase